MFFPVYLTGEGPVGGVGVFGNPRLSGLGALCVRQQQHLLTSRDSATGPLPPGSLDVDRTTPPTGWPVS